MSGSKVAKTVMFTVQAADSHNTMKMKSIGKFLKSGHEVRVQIQGKADRHKAMYNIYSQLETDFKNIATFMQKVEKPERIKVILKPCEATLELDNTETTTTKLDDFESVAMNHKDLLSDDFSAELDALMREERSKIKKKP